MKGLIYSHSTYPNEELESSAVVRVRELPVDVQTIEAVLPEEGDGVGGEGCSQQLSAGHKIEARCLLGAVTPH